MDEASESPAWRWMCAGLRETPSVPRVEDHPKMHNISDEAGYPMPVISVTQGPWVNVGHWPTTRSEHGAGVPIAGLRASDFAH